jgi:hypothetical protein
MTTLITRLYANHDQARAVVDALKAKGFKDKDIDLISLADGSGIPASKLMEAFRKAWVPASSAVIYAEGVRQGEAVVAFRAPVGTFYKAKAIIDQFPSIDAGVKHTEVHLEATTTPKMRQTRYLPELLKHDQRFLDSFFPDIARGPRTFVFGRPELPNYKPKANLITGNTIVFSSRLGLPLLANKR